MYDTHHSIFSTTDTELADKIREHFPKVDSRSIAEYLEALHGYETARTPATFDRLVTAAHLLTTPTIDLDHL